MASAYYAGLFASPVGGESCFVPQPLSFAMAVAGAVVGETEHVSGESCCAEQSTLFAKRATGDAIVETGDAFGKTKQA